MGPRGSHEEDFPFNRSVVTSDFLDLSLSLLLSFSRTVKSNRSEIITLDGIL